ncbi:MAG: histidine triad nucleotide-binding protein [Armatimonadetes bacterium]|nr:histidine triad nucleotide-binding protein [Armatimonadota bacterium]
MSECLFCKIANLEIPVEAVLESDRGMVFPDISPQAPVHLLVIPKEHYADLDAATRDPELIGHLLALATEAARSQGLTANGYRVVANTGPDAGQSVPHLHFHILGGRMLGWPPG